MSVAVEPGLQVRLRCLGPAQVTGADDELIKFETRKHVLLLYYLARHPGRPVSRDELIDLFWHGDDERKARHSLSHAVSLINKSLHIEAIIPAGSSRLLLKEGIVWLDVREFERLVAEGQMIEARLLWDGTLFEGYWIRKAPKVEEWIGNERSRVERTFRRVLHEVIEEHRSTGDHEMMRNEAETLLGLDDLDEKAMLAYLEALTLLGDRTLALRSYAAFERKITDELSAAPSSELRGWAKRHRQGNNETVRTSNSRNEYATLPVAQPMYGRESEFAQLWDSWERAKVGRGVLLAVRGQAGIGKTTIITRLASQAHVAGGTVCFARCFRSEKSIPFAPIPGLIRQLSRMPGFVGVSGVWLGELSRLVPELRDRFPGLPLPLAIDDSARHRLSDAVVQAVEAICEEQSLLLAIDELQDADEATLALIHFVARQAGRLPLLVVCGYRTGASHSDLEKAFMTSAAKIGFFIDLGALSQANTERLVRQVLAREGNEASDSLVSTLAERSHGNPLHAIEAAISAHSLPTHDDSESVEDVASVEFDDLAIDRLSLLARPAQGLAGALAVAERPLSEYELAEITTLPPSDVAMAIHALEGASFIRLTTRTVALAHERYGAAILQKLGDHEARSLHLRCARLFARSAATDGWAHYQVARHYQSGGRGRNAAIHAKKAAMFAESIGATRERAAALEVLKAIDGPTPDLIADLGRCYLDLHDLTALERLVSETRATANSEEVLAELDYIDAAAATLSFRKTLPLVEARLVDLCHGRPLRHKRDAMLLLVLVADKTGNYGLVRRTAREMRKGPKEKWTEHAYFVTGYVFAKYYWPSKAIEFFEAAIHECQKTRNWTLEQFSRECLAISLKLTGLFDQSIEHYRRSLAIARKVLNPVAEARCLQNLAVSQMAIGELQQAWETLNEVPTTMNLLSDHYTSYNRGVIRFQQQDYASAKGYFLTTFENTAKANHSLLASDACAFAALSCQRLGDLELFRELNSQLKLIEPRNADFRLGFVSQAASAWQIALDGDYPSAAKLLKRRARQLARRDVALWASVELELIVLSEAFLKQRQSDDRIRLMMIAKNYGMNDVVEKCEQ